MLWEPCATSTALCRRRRLGKGESVSNTSIKELIGPWERVEWVTFKVKAAEFQTGIPAWGRVKFKVTVHGTGADGGPRAITASGSLR